MNEYIPDEALRYFPKDDKVYKGSGQSIVRYIFYETEYTKYEEEQLKEFFGYLDYNNSDRTLICREEILRTLIGCKFDFKKTLTAIENSIAWRKNVMPLGLVSLHSKVEKLLNSGAIYIHGRDHRYRPLIVLNAGKLDLELYNIEDYTNLLCYVLEFASTKLMIKGHIENWIVITDLNNKSLTNLPLSELKQIISVLQNNFRCRMIVNYIVNAPRALSFIWGVLKKFIEPHTVNKIRIIRDSKADEMKTHFATGQYEEKYGGSCQNLTGIFWPPVLPPGPYEAEGEPVGEHLEINKHENELYFTCCLNDVGEEDSVLNDSVRGTVYYDPVIFQEFGDSFRKSRKTRPVSQNEPRGACCKACLLF
jgi:hypothetical protein